MSDERTPTEKLAYRSQVPFHKEPLSPDCPLATGSLLGRYRILRPLGAGGMGAVYVAEDVRLRRQVAVKVIRSTVFTTSARARFEQEARAASGLTHPNIITIFDIGDADDQPFIVMELLEGNSLRELVNEPFSFDRLQRIAVQIADALTVTHERGIVHRDLKPENIFVTSDGNAKILDFGIARIRHGGDQDEGFPTEERLTIEGSAVGTIGYMAPEVISGQRGDFRADVFSFGCILYEMAAGRRPFTGKSVMEILAACLSEHPPPLSSQRSDLPPAFSSIVERALRKDPDERFPSTRILLDELRRMSGGAVPVMPAEAAPLSLPRVDFPLLGREAELEKIESMFVEEGTRLVTLTGPGGSGKTRLAIAAAEKLQGWFSGRVYFVSLASVSEHELVGAAIARVLGAVDPARAPLPSVIAQLRATEQRTLLVIDNFEQVVEAAADLAELISACSAVSILVTSREILHLYAERNLLVPPLPVPESSGDTTSAAAMESPAVMLFLQRARAVNPDVEIDASSLSAIVEICRHLDGLPLAIELAAARTRLITPRAMLARLGERLKLLTGGARDLPDRQQTLRRTLDWSYELLGPEEQRLLRRLAVFAGSFSLEQAEAVADPFGRLEIDIVDGVGSLVDKSLLVRKGEEDGDPRFGMLGMVRDYAAERLSTSGEEQETRKAHAAYFLVLAEEAGQALGRGEEEEWMVRLGREHDNLRAALEWTTAAGLTEWGLRIAVGIFPFWERSEHLSEGRRRLEALLADRAGADRLLRARGLFALSVLACTQKEYRVASSRAEESLALYRELEDRGGIAVSCNCLGLIYTERRELGQAATILEESLALWQASGDEASYARTLTNLAMVRRLQGEHEAARQMYTETEALFLRIGDRSSAARARNRLGDVASEMGQPDEAASYYESALQAFRELGDGWGVASSLVDIGNLARRCGRIEEAAAAYRESLEEFNRLGHMRGTARVLEVMALLAVEQERAERALTLAGAASRLRELAGAPLPEEEQAELDRGLERARAALDLEGARQPFQCGRCMGVGEATAYALRSAD
jgi:predicted ATPase/predicted Ser/Thr protein kinase